VQQCTTAAGAELFPEQENQAGGEVQATGESPAPPSTSVTTDISNSTSTNKEE
jgi:hypothetical protein